MARALVLDCETTGREPPEVRSLAAVMVDDSLTVLYDESGVAGFERGYTTEQPSTATARSVHKLPELINGPPAERAWPDLVDWADGPIDYIIAHNVDYDWTALGEPNVKRICTLALSRELYDDDEGHSLGAMMFRIFPFEEAVERLNGHHIAACDVGNCLDIARHVAERMGIVTLDDLYEASENARIPKRMTFGKHRGELIADVPESYCRWYLAQGETDPYVVRAMEDRLLGVPRRSFAVR